MTNKSISKSKEVLKSSKITGLSLPETVVAYIDSQRGDISRSRYVLRLIETSINSPQKQNIESYKKEYQAESLRELSAN